MRSAYSKPDMVIGSTTEIFWCRLVSSFDFKDETPFCLSVRLSSSWMMIWPMLTLNKYELNHLDLYCKFKKYKKFQLMLTIFVLSIYNTMCHRIHMKVPHRGHNSYDRVMGYAWKCLMDDMIPVIESRDMYKSTSQMTRFLWQNHENSI